MMAIRTTTIRTTTNMSELPGVLSKTKLKAIRHSFGSLSN